MSFGEAAHLGIEKGSPEAARDFVLKGLERAFGQEAEDDVKRTAGVVEAMVTGALTLWPTWPAAREVEFLLPLKNPGTGRRSRRHCFAGKLDGLGDHAVFEFKTTSRLDSSYVDRLDVDFQVSAYLEAASQMLGRKIRRVVYRIAKKPSIKQRRSETLQGYLDRVNEDYLARPEFYFHEEVVRRSDDQMDLWRREAWALHKQILAVENGGFAIRNTESCVGRFGRCAFLDLCCGAVGEDAYDRVDRPHQELALEGAL